MITNEDIARLDEIYVRKDECEGFRSAGERDMRELAEKSVEKKTRQNITIGILCAIGTILLSMAIKVLFGG